MRHMKFIKMTAEGGGYGWSGGCGLALRTGLAGQDSLG